MGRSSSRGGKDWWILSMFFFFSLLSFDFQSMIMGLELKAVEGKISVGSDCSHHNLYSWLPTSSVSYDAMYWGETNLPLLCVRGRTLIGDGCASDAFTFHRSLYAHKTEWVMFTECSRHSTGLWPKSIPQSRALGIYIPMFRLESIEILPRISNEIVHFNCTRNKMNRYLGTILMYVAHAAATSQHV